jgi:RNA polymerase sigma-70 factor (ECF subfamily)
MASEPVPGAGAPANNGFLDLYERYRARLQRYFLVVFRDPHEAEDAAHQVFLKAEQSAERYRGEGTPEAWLFAIARNHALEHHRRNGRLELLAPAELDRLRESHAEDLSPRSADWISREDVRALVDALPIFQRRVLLLRYLFGCPHAETARVLATTHDSVRQAHATALRSLERALSKSDSPFERRSAQSLRRLRMPWQFAGSSFTLAPAERRLAA